MKNYLAIPFHGDRHDEDPSEFLNWFLQYMGTADSKMKARNFIYYLQADSLADEWFEELGEEEKGSWDLTEVLFRKKWLKEEELSIKEPAAVENQPHSPPVTSYLIDKTEMVPQIAPNRHNEPPATPQSRTPIENGKKLENSPYKRIFTEFRHFSFANIVFYYHRPTITFDDHCGS
jgi:hypothetical protein